MDMDLDIKIDPDLLQIRLRSTHRYPNPIQIHFKPIQIRSDWIWITWILDHVDLGSRGSWIRSNPLLSLGKLHGNFHLPLRVFINYLIAQTY